MSLHFHFIKKCECGIIISQCQCAPPDTAVDVVQCKPENHSSVGRYPLPPTEISHLFILRVRKELVAAEKQRLAGGGNGHVPVQLTDADQMDELKDHFTPEQWNRIDVIFQPGASL